MSSIYILGISAFYHDSAACLICDGRIIAGALEERFSRKKHDSSFPKKAIEWCLKSAGIKTSNLHCVVFYEKPILKFDRILNSVLNNVPFGFTQFRKSMHSWLSEKLWMESLIQKELSFKVPIKFCTHHHSHVATAFYSSGFNECAFLVVDAVGESASTSYGLVNDGEILTLGEQHYPHSLGMLYSAFTQYCGFRVNNGEYKLMGLAPYGQPKYADLIRNNLVTISEDCSLKLNMNYFHFERGMQMINQKFEALFGAKTRHHDKPISNHFKDIAASIQLVLEEYLVQLVRFVQESTGQKKLCFSGGVALNCVANSKLRDSGIFSEIHIPSAPGDAGAAIGAALHFWHQGLKKPYQNFEMKLSEVDFIGPTFSSLEIEIALKSQNLPFKTPAKEDLIQEVCLYLTQGEVVGWFQGNMEFGPRALGNRSILASPIPVEMKDKLNAKIKFREGFRPFAPIVIEERSYEWFEMEKSPRMLYTANCLQAKRIPSCVHIDGSSRLQSVSQKDHPLLWELIRAFENETGVPVLINTSFNVKGEPIVCTPDDAISCFMNTGIDHLVIGECIVSKRDL